MSASPVVHSGKLDAASNQWLPYEWHDAQLGKQVWGEAAVTLASGTSGDLQAGFWRISSATEADGSLAFAYPSPAGDDVTCVLEGSATVTVTDTGERYDVRPGSIFSTPQGLRVDFDIAPPSFKTAWLIWKGSRPTADPPRTLQVNHDNDNPGQWLERKVDVAGLGPRVVGDFCPIWTKGSSGNFSSCIGRVGGDVAATDAAGNMAFDYVAEPGDESILLLEGHVEIMEMGSGARHAFSSGDIIGLPRGLPVTWISKGPCKFLSIMTHDD